MDFPRCHNMEELPKLIMAVQLELKIKDVGLEDKTTQPKSIFFVAFH
jgi:hypothetical protein